MVAKVKFVAITFISAITILYLFIFAGIYVYQGQLVFHPDVRPISPAAAGLPTFQSVSISQGQASWWHAPSSPSAPVILYFHGNGGALAGRSAIFAEMAQWGAGVLAVGYPGYGGNQGAPSEPAIHKTAQANYNWLIKQGIDPKRIVITAHSMGTGVAVPLAAKNKAAGLILESPFTSLADVAQRQMWMFPVKYLVSDPFNSAAQIQAVDMPIVWMHGTSDQLIPYEMGQSLFTMIKGPKCYLRIDGGDHDNLWSLGVNAFTKRQAFAMVKTGGCDGSPVLLQDGELLPG
jgi:uncharacterized protein